MLKKFFLKRIIEAITLKVFIILPKRYLLSLFKYLNKEGKIKSPLMPSNLYINICKA